MAAGVAGALWPLAAKAQQPRRIGLLRLVLLPQIADFRAGLEEIGFAEGRNLIIDDRLAEGDYARLPELAADLVRRHVEVLVCAGGTESVRVAMRATAAIPIVGTSVVPTDDPFELVKHHNRPEGNVTGIGIITGDLMPKRLQILAELMPGAIVGVLLNPTYSNHQRSLVIIEAAARELHLKLTFANASADADLAPAVAALAGQGAGAVIAEAEPFLGSRWQRLVLLAEQHKLPMLQEWQHAVAAGGLISYAPSLRWVYRQLGRYTGQLLNGAKPADLPIVAPDKIEMAVNLKTAKALGLAVPPALLARADEVIE